MGIIYLLINKIKKIDTVAVTGATGFIGRGLILYLLKHGIKIKAFLKDDKYKQSKYLLQEGVSVDVVGDLSSNQISKEKLADVDYLVHLASLAHLDLKKINTKKDIINEARKISINVATAAKNSGLKGLVFISSIKVCGEKTTDFPFSESTSLNPKDDYGKAKLESENIIKSIYPDVIILRPPLVYGPYVKGNFRQLLNIVYKGFPLPIKSINNKRSFIYLYNLTDSILSVMSNEKSKGKTFLVSDLGTYSSFEIVSKVSKLLTGVNRTFKI